MKKRIIYTILFIIMTSFISVIITLIIIDTSDTPSTYDTVELKSKVLQETRELIIKKPENYKKDAKYPVVYVVGGNSLTYTIANDTDLLSRVGNIPEVIVVGITGINQKTRQRDLTPPFLKQDLDDTNSSLGEADNFLKYIKSEVIPLVEENYNTNNQRTIIGHSREGLLVFYSLIFKPDLFDTRIALSPALWREDNKFVKHFEIFLNENPNLSSNLFMSMGEDEVDKMKIAFDLMVDVLKHKDLPNFNSKSFYMPNATHQTNHYLTACIGIDYFFNQNKKQ
ncbi:alpha/beta hydrolase [Winogradskyella luteola]|uniref:Alpha/beta hydrolase n=1 Tax=Winogradskyella luteola TaxID=2828330 RepID=A0A9X1JQH3_9FLAO|nr:alpha/beta hydrolase-fold protein [Winogradskyella luteola]MBV7267577.1 alpha/beta hydrolase [Winogradskyella luteola]